MLPLTLLPPHNPVTNIFEILSLLSLFLILFSPDKTILSEVNFESPDFTVPLKFLKILFSNEFSIKKLNRVLKDKINNKHIIIFDSRFVDAGAGCAHGHLADILRVFAVICAEIIRQEVVDTCYTVPF